MTTTGIKPTVTIVELMPFLDDGSTASWFYRQGAQLRVGSDALRARGEVGVSESANRMVSKIVTHLDTVFKHLLTQQIRSENMGHD